MRKPHPRIRKATKWTSAALALILIAAWGVSEFSIFGIRTNHWNVQVYFGNVLVYYDHSGTSFGLTPTWIWLRFDDANEDRSWWIKSSPPMPWFAYTTVTIPLWMPLSFFLLLSGTAWRFDTLARRRNQSHLCQNCSYNLTGLKPGSNCPECNTTPPPLSVECKE